MRLAFLISTFMGVRKLENMIACQLAVAFKLEVYRIVDASPEASRDLRYKGQVCDAASGVDSNMSEGVARYRPAEICRFLSYSLGSLAEAKVRLKDGIHRRHFTEADCKEAVVLAVRCRKATINWHKSLQRYIPQRGARRKNRAAKDLKDPKDP